MSEILRFDPARRTNAQLMVDCRTLGYLTDDQDILDPTYGQGGFWKSWTPLGLIASDLDPSCGVAVADFTNLPHASSSFDVVVFDPPYKLNGTSAHPSDDRYGVGGEYRSVEEKLDLIKAGCVEAARVARDRVLVKCQDQVNAGKVVWQSHIVTNCMTFLGAWRLADRLEVHSYRPQPPGRSQQHARGTTSSLLVFEAVPPSGARS